LIAFVRQDVRYGGSGEPHPLRFLHTVRSRYFHVCHVLSINSDYKAFQCLSTTQTRCLSNNILYLGETHLPLLRHAMQLTAVVRFLQIVCNVSLIAIRILSAIPSE
jgi:hypothetical protein